MKNEIVLVDSDVEDVKSEIRPRKKAKLDKSPARGSTSYDDTVLGRVTGIPEITRTQTDRETADSHSEYVSNVISKAKSADSMSHHDHVGVESDSEDSMHETDLKRADSDSECASSLSIGFDGIKWDSGDLEDASLVEEIHATRAFLKTQGPDLFLEQYLPVALSTEDITALITKLGFQPCPPPNEDDEVNMMQLIRHLNFAMTKVLATRDRLPHVVNVDDVNSLIKSCSKILVITGAGISTSLGIPDFRSSRGFYAQVERLGLSDPQEVFDLNLFYADPTLFYSIAHMILPPSDMYSPLHAFIAVLQRQNKLLRNYTQNIDNLETCAGISPDKVVQCHGLFAHATCVTCQHRVKGEEIFDDLRAQRIAYCPRCTPKRIRLLNSDDDNLVIPESYGVFKPDITFFGESLPDHFHDKISNDLEECDLIIAVGTSLKVAPVADIVLRVPQHVPQILINRDPIDHCQFDVSLLGYCDDVAAFLANRLGTGWELPHPQFESICGARGENLELRTANSGLREYNITKKNN